MKFLLVSLALVTLPALTGSAAPPPAGEAQRAHAQGACGQLGPGTGLSASPSGPKGWVVSMLPGRHEFRMEGGGSVFVTASRQAAADVDAGRPYFLVIEGARPGSVLEWKAPGSGWSAIPTYFLYPLQR